MIKNCLKDYIFQKKRHFANNIKVKFPVISISLKDVDGRSYERSLKKMETTLKKEIRRHQYLLKGDNYRKLIKTLSDICLQILSMRLSKKKVFIY